MSRETAYHGIILKKQSLGEADELITLYTLEEGKIRALAKGVKRATSKLQYALQPLSQVRVTVVSGRSSLPRIIRSENMALYSIIRGVPEAVAWYFWMAELLMKGSADGEANKILYDACLEHLSVLDRPGWSLDRLPGFSAHFLLHFTTALGFGVRMPEPASVHTPFRFSNDEGGFIALHSQDAHGGMVSSEAVAAAVVIAGQQADVLLTHSIPGSEELFRLLSGFVVYQLERTLKSERFLGGF